MLRSFIRRMKGDTEMTSFSYYSIKEEQHGCAHSCDCQIPEITDRYRAHGSQRLWSAVCLLSGLLIGAVGVLVAQRATSRQGNPLLGEQGTVVPRLPFVKTTFERDELFASPPSIASDRAWDSLMPSGDGFVVVDDSQALGLPPGIQNPDGEKYDVSMFHQLHCLKQIRETLFITRVALNSTNAKQIDQTMIEPSMMHIYHCFDYIRQAVMCAGDMTLEWPRTEDDGQRFAVDGWGVTHQCKSWEAISEYMTEHRQLL